jgi:hypothetical protein
MIAGAEKSRASCARRSPGDALKDAGSIPATSTNRKAAVAAAPKLATSIQYTNRTPTPASSSPATADPATRPNWNRAWKMAFAVETSDRWARFGDDGAAPGIVQRAEPGR